MDITIWAYEAQCGLQKAEGISKAARAKAWKDWVVKADRGGKCRLGAWVKEEGVAPVISAVSTEGGISMQPTGVATQFVLD